jgi:hypothetical protein
MRAERRIRRRIILVLLACFFLEAGADPGGVREADIYDIISNAPGHVPISHLPYGDLIRAVSDSSRRGSGLTIRDCIDGGVLKRLKIV